MKIKEPEIVKTIFPAETLKEIQRYILSLYIEKPNYDEHFGRHQWANTPELKKYHNMLIDLAREYFESDKLKPSWVLASAYEGKQAKLWKHKDDNACTYHINFCVFQKTPWDLWVEGNPYTLQENDAVMTYGNDHEHWREEFPEPDTNLVANIFFFFCEPDHWYFTEGPDYLNDVIRKKN